MTTKNMTRGNKRISDSTRDEMAKKLRMERDKDRELVKGVFKYYEVPGGSVGFCFKKYAEDPVEKFILKDGYVYSLPLGVAKHINNNTWYPVHEYFTDENGASAQRHAQKVRRMAFQSLEFMDMDDMSNNINKIVAVENVITR
jgi:hypothetical protein